MEMGKEIRRLRTDRGLTQEALAAALNVSPQTVSKWECGNSVPDVQLLPEIAVFFGVTIDQLFAMTPEQRMERIENHIYSSGVLSEAEERQIEQQVRAFAENPKHAGHAKTLLTKLYNHQAEQYRRLATACGKEAVEASADPGTRSASWPTPGAAICRTGTSAITTRSSTGSVIFAAATPKTAPL